MKKAFFTLSIIMAISCLVIPDLEARGGRGGGGSRGGGSRGGGGGRAPSRGGGKSVQRSPSMSRSTRSSPVVSRNTRPNRTAQRPVNRQNLSNRNVSRNDVQNFLQQRPSSNRPTQRPATRPVDQRNLGQNVRNDIGQNLNRGLDQRNFGQNVRNEIGRNDLNLGDRFNDNSWNRHNINPPFYGQNLNWARWATAAGIGSWLGWQTSPLYYGSYDDGDWGPVTDTGTTQVYYEPAQQPVQQPIETATTTTPQQQTSGDWMPLGVFSLTTKTETATAPNLYLQLALNKNGEISGTYYNVKMDKMYEVEGDVDKDTQRVALKGVGLDNSPILETGIYNLTQSEAPVRVHFNYGKTQDMLLVRVDEQKD